MKRRDFSISAIAALLLSATAGRALAQGPDAPQAGKEFVELKKPIEVTAPKGKVEVVEFFSYTCNHCRDFAPIVMQWQKTLPEYVYFRHSAVAFNKRAAPLQKLYFTLEAMNKVEEFHLKAFDAVWKERKPMSTDEEILTWGVGQMGEDFKKYYNSFDVANRVARANELQAAYMIEGTPTVGVNGRWWTDGVHAGSHQGTLRVVDFLVGQEHKRMQS